MESELFLATDYRLVEARDVGFRTKECYSRDGANTFFPRYNPGKVTYLVYLGFGVAIRRKLIHWVEFNVPSAR